MPITVLHLLHRLTFGGTERVVVNLVTHSGPEVINFVCSFDEPDAEFLNELGTLKHRVFSMQKREGNDLHLPFRLAALCKQQRVDIVHSLGWGTYAEGLIATKLLSRNTAFLHSFRGKTAEDTNYIPKRRILAQRIFSWFCDVIITPSQMSQKEYANLIGIDPKRIVVIYNGVQAQDFAASFHEKGTRDPFGLKFEDIVLGCVARFDPVKNVMGLIRAFAKMDHETAKRCRLLLVGGGPELADAKRLASDSGVGEQVVFLGMRRDIPRCLHLMDVYVQPSKFEGMPNAVIEAMAAGLPVVATNVGGVCEAVAHGVNGFLVTPDDDADLVNRLTEIVRNPGMRKAMGAAGKKRVQERFSMERMISDYERLYRSILKKDVPVELRRT